MQRATQRHTDSAPQPRLAVVDIVVRLVDGGRFVVSAPVGSRAVDAIRAYGLPLKGECEGRCTCASCHVRVAERWADRLDLPDAAEAATLRAMSNAGHTSRLLCQLALTPDLDGLDIEIDPASLVPQTSWAAG